MTQHRRSVIATPCSFGTSAVREVKIEAAMTTLFRRCRPTRPLTVRCLSNVFRPLRVSDDAAPELPLGARR